MTLKIATFHDLPLPPTINKCYTNHSYYPARRIASSLLRDFKASIDIYRLQHLKEVNDCIYRLKDIERQDGKFPAIELVLILHLPYKMLYTLKNVAKRFDVSNRIKPLEDALTGMLEFDDQHIWSITAAKALTKKESPNVEAIFSVYMVC